MASFLTHPVIRVSQEGSSECHLCVWGAFQGQKSLWCSTKAEGGGIQGQAVERHSYMQGSRGQLGESDGPSRCSNEQRLRVSLLEDRIIQCSGKSKVIIKPYLLMWPYTPGIPILISEFSNCPIWEWEKERGDIVPTTKKSSQA